MKVIILLSTLTAFAYGGAIHHHDDHKGHGKATSFQNIKLDHFHPVAVYIKKEDLKYLEHPVEIGKSSSSVKQEHGNKHEHGHAVQDVNHHINHHGHDEHGHEHQIQVQSGGYGHHHGYQEVPVVHEEPQYNHQRVSVPVYQVHQQDESQGQQEAAGHGQQESSGQYQGGYQGGYHGGQSLGNYQLANVDGYTLDGQGSHGSSLGQRYTTVDLNGGHGKSS